MIITKNAIQCLHCGDIIESKHRHDYVACKCAKVSVDGGKDYCKRGFPSKPPEEHYKDLTEWAPSKKN